MLTFDDQYKLSQFLTETATALDIPEYVYEDATLKYEDIGTWLSADESELKSYAPEIYPQGSFRLGTVVRPVSGKDGYDIDLVCHLELQKEQTTQKDLKQMVGRRLQKREDLARKLEPSRRCWTLNYPAEGSMPHFHMDVLPAIPNREHPPTGILITDTDLIRWQKSNPKAYADWFFLRMNVAFLQRKAIVAKQINADVADVPEWQVKTPLQVVIQILKRHRDIVFLNNLDDKPTSIIITTLAALAYSDQTDVYEALRTIVGGMSRHIEKRQGIWWIANPVDADENFADKWNEHPDEQESFGRWLRQAQADFSALGQQQTFSKVITLLGAAVGQKEAGIAATKVGLQTPWHVPTSMPALPLVPSLGNASHCQPPIWPIQETYRARVTGSVHFQENGPKLWSLTSRSVPKNVHLKFTVITNAPKPYSVQWQVVNTGKEAVDARGLRGGFYESTNVVSSPDVRWERTLYNGSHWIEAFIIRAGVCVARSGRTVVRIH